MLRSAAKFFDGMSNFRLVFMTLLFCDIRYMFPYVYYPLVVTAVIWGFCLFIKKMMINKGIQKIRFRKIIYLFFACACLSVLLHCTTNFVENLFSLLMMGVCLFLFYGIHSEKSNFRVRKEMKRMLGCITLVSTFLMAVGLVVLAVFPKGIHINGFDFGIHESRFVGVIPNANVNAFYAVMALVSCHMLWRMKKADGTLGFKYRIFLIVCAVIDMTAVFLTDSNDTLLFFIVYICFIAFYRIFRDFGKAKILNFLMRLTSTVLACIVIAVGLAGLRTLTQGGVSLLITAGSSKNEISTGIKTDKNGSVKIEDDTDRNTTPPKTESNQSSARKKTENNTFKHENKNIDSGRFVLWRQSLVLIEQNPIMGIGKANIVEYGTKYLGSLKYTQLGDFQYVDFHNGLLTIVVSFGLVGFNIFMILAVTIAKTILKAIFRFKEQSRKDGEVLVLIAAFCAAYCAYSMFEAALFADDSYRVFIFWIMIGFGLSYVFKYQKKKKIECGYSNENTRTE